MAATDSVTEGAGCEDGPGTPDYELAGLKGLALELLKIGGGGYPTASNLETSKNNTASTD